jgi:hypothetical protein
VGREKRSILQESVKYVQHIRVLFWEIPFGEELLDYLHAVSAFSGSGA